MNKKFLAVLLIGVMTMAAAAQLNLATIKGKATDDQGQPMAGAEIRMSEAETGRKYTLKTDKNGGYQSIAIQPGKYKITLVKDNVEIFNLNNVTVSLANPENIIDFDMRKERALAAKSGAQQMTEAQRKEMEQVNKENLTVKDLNNLLAQARAAKDAGDTDTALSTIDKAITVDGNRDLLWYTKGDIQATAAKKEADRAAKKQKFTEAATSFGKAIELANASTDPKGKSLLGNHLEGQAKAFEGAGEPDKAATSYEAAAKFYLSQTPPNNKQAAIEYFNMGAVYTNANKGDEAIKAFDRTLELDPEKAEAYFYKGSAMLAKGELKDGKLIAPEGTDEALNKYLELKPDGPLSADAKAMLGAIGSEVKTSYKAKRDKKK
jgi:tetratricopeptide (TPR) repeat protein